MTGSGWIIQYLCNFNPALSPQIAWRPLLVVVGPIIPQRLPRAHVNKIFFTSMMVFCVLFSVIFLLSLSLLYAVNMSYPSQHPAIISPASKQPREWVVNNEEIREGAPPGLRLLLYGSYSGEIYGAINQLSLMWGIKQKGCRRLTSNNNCSNFSFISLLTGGLKREMVRGDSEGC